MDIAGCTWKFAQIGCMNVSKVLLRHAEYVAAVAGQVGETGESEDTSVIFNNSMNIVFDKYIYVAGFRYKQ